MSLNHMNTLNIVYTVNIFATCSIYTSTHTFSNVFNILTNTGGVFTRATRLDSVHENLYTHTYICSQFHDSRTKTKSPQRRCLTWIGFLSVRRWMISKVCFTIRTAISFLPLFLRSEKKKVKIYVCTLVQTSEINIAGLASPAVHHDGVDESLHDGA